MTSGVQAGGVSAWTQRAIAFFGVLILSGIFGGDALAVAPWTGTRTGPGSIYYHGPNGIPWNADTGRYVRWDVGSGGSATAVSVYEGTIGRVPIEINGSQVATAASIAAAFLPVAKTLGNVGLAIMIAEAAWDAANHIWNKQGDGSQGASGIGSCDLGSTNSCTGGFGLSHCDTMPVGQVLYNAANGSACVREPSAAHGCANSSGPAGFTNQGRYVQDGSMGCGWTSTWGRSSGFVPQTTHPASDSELTTAIEHAITAQPTQADDAASQAEANGQQVTLGQLNLSGPSSLDAGTTTSTTTGPSGTATQSDHTVYNITYNTNNVYNNTSVTTTKTDSSGTTTTTTNSGPNAPQTDNAQTPQMPVSCGSLSCESTQQQVKTEVAGVHQDTTAIKTDTAAMRTDLTGVHTDTTAIKTELQAAAAPTLPDQATALDAAKAADKVSSDAVVTQITSGQNADKSLWTAWMWTPPSASCQAPSATLSNGRVVTIDYCPLVANIRDTLGWLFAMYGIWNIYGQMFKRSEG